MVFIHHVHRHMLAGEHHYFMHVWLYHTCHALHKSHIMILAQVSQLYAAHVTQFP